MASNIDSEDLSYIIVAAIDFGTTFSGYAFSFKTDQDNIRMNKSWGHNMGFQSYKTPTCVLTNSLGEFAGFGFDAEDKYAEMQEGADDSDSDSDGNCSEHYHLYRHFKMMLFKNEKLTRKSTIASVDGKLTPAMGIFVMALRYLKEHLITAVSKQITGEVEEKLFRWVITVPAIWREEAKQFMREVAYQAGFIENKDSGQLIIALEPETASLFCRSLNIDNFLGGPEKTSFKTGCKYIVIDAGGGTVDLTIHEVLLSGNVKEIHRANGGDWGGTQVDANFIALLEDILGKNFVHLFKQQCPQQWLRFMIMFEKVKRAAKPDGKTRICIDILHAMSSKFTEICGKPIDRTIKEKGRSGVSFSNGLLILKHQIVVSLFQPVVDEIVSHVKELVKVPNVSECSYILLVGGFAESEFLQTAIIESFKHKMITLVPEEAQMSVIKGAVFFGHNPDQIQIRMTRYFYGIAVNASFDPTQHDLKYKTISDDGIEQAKDVYHILVDKDQAVEVGETRIKTYRPSSKTQSRIRFEVFRSDIKVMYTDDETCTKVGQFIVKSPNTAKGFNRVVSVEVTFGGTEVQLKGTDMESGHTAETLIDFLS